MNVKIQSINFICKQEMENFIQENPKKLYRLYNKTLSCEVVSKVEKSEMVENKFCDIRMIIPGNVLAGDRSATFEEATMQTIDALERQIHIKATKTLQGGNKKTN